MISTRFGNTHVVASGSIDAPALILFHGMTFSAEEAANWVLDVLAGLQLQSAIFIGYSMGVG